MACLWSRSQKVRQLDMHSAREHPGPAFVELWTVQDKNCILVLGQRLKGRAQIHFGFCLSQPRGLAGHRVDVDRPGDEISPGTLTQESSLKCLPKT